MTRNLQLYKKVGFFVAFFVVFAIVLTLVNERKIQELSLNKSPAVVKNAEFSQISTLPGLPLLWTAKITASAVNSGQHLLMLPKNSRDIKVGELSQARTISIFGSSTIDRLELSKISKQNARSVASLALVKSLRKQKEEKYAITEIDNGLKSKSLTTKLTASVLYSMNLFGNLMKAAVEEAVTPNELAPEPEVTVVDVAPNEASELNSSSTTEVPADSGTSTIPVENVAVQDTTTATSTVNSLPSTSDDGSTSSTSATSSTLIIPTPTTTPAVIPARVTEDVVVQYETPAPVIAEASTETGKIVTITDSVPENSDLPHTTNVLAFTNIPEIYKVGQENKIKIKWLNNNEQEVVFHAYDLNNNGKLDYVEWTVPHLSTQTFEIIFISKALELDENKEIIGDIYDQVKTQDGNWASVSSGHTVQVTFEKYLTDRNDNTIYARTSGTTSSAIIEVYPVYDGMQSSLPVAIFEKIEDARIYKVWLTNLPQPTNIFNLKAIGDVEIDYIVDPTPVTVTELFADTTKVASSINISVDTNNGQVTLTPTSAWTCGSPLVDFRDGKSYATVLIGAQCWMQQNLNVGTRINAGTVQGTSASDIKKFCSGNSEANCTTYGGWYQRDQVLAGSNSPGTQGICPTNWHVPTHNEFTTLERSLCTSGSCATDFPYDTTTTGARGTNEGTVMKDANGVFKALLAGNWGNGGGQFYNSGNLGVFFTSTWYGSSIWRRVIANTAATISRDTDNQSYDAFSVRCLKD